MKRKDYERPTMNVFECEEDVELLAGSVEAMRSGYGTAVEETWGDEPSSSRKGGGYNWDEENEAEF